MRSRWVCRRRHVLIQKPFMRRITGCVAVPIARVATAMSRNLLLPRRPHILPGARVSDSTGRRPRRILRNAAPGRRRTRIVIDPIHNVSHSNVRANIVRGNYRRAFPFIHNNPRTVNSRAKFLLGQRLRPGTQIRVVAIEKPPTLFHIQENHRAFRKSFTAPGGRSGLCVCKPCLNGILFIGKLPGSPSLIQQQKSKSLRLHRASFANPRVGLLSRRRAQPIAREGKGLAKKRQRGVAGILVAVETRKVARFGGNGWMRIKPCKAERNHRKGRQE